MNDLIIKDNIIPELADILALYNDAQWTAYTHNPEQLQKAIRHSLKVWTVWDNQRLVGLARVVGDGCTIIYIQDILVLKSYQGNGVGSRLLQLILENYQFVRQVVLLTDDTKETARFYEKNGLKNVQKHGCAAFMK